MKSLVLGVVMCLLHAAAEAKLTKQPNFVVVVVDDLGFNDVGWNGSPDIKTPYMDQLVREEGMPLRNYYVQPLCTPSRAQLLWGMHEVRLGLQHDVIHSGHRNAVPIGPPSLADKLRDLGYATHMMGKWNLGHYDFKYIPVNRGFDTFLGILNALGRQYSHGAMETFKDAAGNTVKFEGHDWWEGEEVSHKEDGQYATHVFTSRFQQLLDEHMANTPDKPFFMDVSYSAVHSPLEAPAQYTDQYVDVIKDINRFYYAGMMSAVDEGVYNITQALKAHGVWDNTILVFTTDNGGTVNFGGDNYPYRGQKQTMWDGAFRGAAFVASPLLSEGVIGQDSTTWLHISDWYPTFVHLAGGSISGQTLDGFDVWDALNTNGESDRVELFHNIDPAVPPKGVALPGSPFDVRTMASLRQGDWKIITGNAGDGNWYQTHTVTPDAPLHPRNGTFAPVDGYEEYEKGYIYRNNTDPANKNLWLFNIRDDPYEITDVSKQYPDKVQELLGRLAWYRDNVAVPLPDLRMDLLANPSLHGGNFHPWVVNNQPPPQY